MSDENKMNGSPALQTVGDMFRELQKEIDAIKAGELPLDTARVVGRHRALQLKTAELNIQYLRVNRAERRKHSELNILTGNVVDSPMNEVKQ